MFSRQMVSMLDLAEREKQNIREVAIQLVADEMRVSAIFVEITAMVWLPDVSRMQCQFAVDYYGLDAQTVASGAVMVASPRFNLLFEMSLSTMEWVNGFYHRSKSAFVYQNKARLEL